jgi:DNA-binding FrmR family transcriptional regulator
MTDHAAKLLLALKKSQGMLTKVTAMVNDDRYCVDIAQQIRATIGLLRNANTLLLKHHLKCCGKTKLVSPDPHEVDSFIDDLVTAWEGTTK